MLWKFFTGSPRRSSSALRRRSSGALKGTDARMEVVGLLAAGVVHDLNNFLMVVRAHLERAMKGGDELDQRASLEKAAKGCDRSLELLQSTLRFAKGQNVASTVEIGHALDETLAFLPSNVTKKLEIKRLGFDKPITVAAGLIQLQQIFSNLIINAGQAMTAHGSMTISLVKIDAHSAEISFADTGPGMSPEVLGRVFEPFFTTKPPGQGTGLGLTSVRAIVESLDGEIRIESKVGVGTTIHVRLPVAV